MRRILGDGRVRGLGISVLAAACLLIGPFGADGEELQAGEVLAEVKADGGQIVWVPRDGFEKARLRVRGAGRRFEKTFVAGETLALGLRDDAGKTIPDGKYDYELVLVPKGGRAAEARASVDADVSGGGPRVQAGTLSIRQGALADHRLGRAKRHDRPFAPSVKSGGDLVLWGDLTVRGVTSLAVIDPEDGQRALHYGALQGPEAGVYFRGSAKLEKGEAVIELPAHFAKLAEARGLTVQLTPTGAWSRLFVAEKSPRRIVVRAAEGEDGAFDFLVQAVRRGYAGFAVERQAEGSTFPESP